VYVGELREVVNFRKLWTVVLEGEAKLER
jgi:hypothetical protein